MKPYQDHDPIKDQGKAVPHPKQPTCHTYRGRNTGGRFVFERKMFQDKRAEIALDKKRDVETIGVFAVICALVGFKSRR